MRYLALLLLFLEASSLPLQQTSLITLRTLQAPRAGGGNQPPPPTYGPLVLEEWDTSGLLQQSWTPACTLAGLSTETWTEGRLSPRYPWGDQVWFLCRNVPVNSSLATNPAPVQYMVLNEEGLLNTCIQDFVYPNGTNVLNILPYNDDAQGINVFYLLGGGTVGSGPTNPARAAQPRIRVDSAPCAPADTEGALLAFPQGVSINQLRILEGTLYGTGLFQSASGGIPAPTIFQIGGPNTLPTGTRNPTSNIAGFPFVLSVWTDPFSGLWWRTGLNRTGYVALYNNSDETDKVFALPPTASAGTLGGVSWSVATARQEGQNLAVYLTNTSHIVKNTLNGLQNGLPYQSVVQAPSGWRYLSAHARNPSLPTPSATSTPTATSTSSASSSASASASSTTSFTPTSSASTTSRPTSTPSPSASASASANPSATATSSRDPQVSPGPTASNTPSISLTPSTTPSNGSAPIPPYGPNNNAATDSPELSPGAQAGISLGSIAVFCIAGLLLIKYTPVLKNLYTRQFGSSINLPKRPPTVRNPVSKDTPITINHNPNMLIQQRLEQLKDFNKQMTKREVSQGAHKYNKDKLKKEFRPTITGESV